MIEHGGNGRQIELEVRQRVEIQGAELDEYIRTEGEKHSAIKLIKRDVEQTIDSDSDDDIEMNVITGKHDIVVRPEGRSHTGFFKSSRKQYAMFPFHEEKVRYDDYGEIIQVDDYKLIETNADGSITTDDNKENHIKIEQIADQDKNNENGLSMLEKPTKCVSSRKTIEIHAQVQFIDFEGRSDGESLLKILSQLRPRRVIVVRGTPENVSLVAKHCVQSIGARVFTPNKGDIIDATTENHIYQIKLTEALVARLQFQKVKDAEVAWIDAKVKARSKKIVPAASSETNANGSTANGTNDKDRMDIDDEDEANDDIILPEGTDDKSEVFCLACKAGDFY